VKITLVEPTGYSTDWAGPSAKHAEALPDYNGMRKRAAEQRKARMSTPGDPAATSAAVLAIVDADQPPLRVFLGDGPLRIAEADYESRLAEWRAWEKVSVDAHGGA
jgi:hypothetical protein